jgi:hypothetical protein
MQWFHGMFEGRHNKLAWGVIAITMLYAIVFGKLMR